MLTDLQKFAQSLFNQGGQLVNNLLSTKIPTQYIPLVGPQLANAQRIISAAQAPKQQQIQVLKSQPTFTPRTVVKDVIAPMWQYPLRTAAELQMVDPRSQLNSQAFQQGLKTPTGRQLSNIAFGEGPLKSYTQRYNEGYDLLGNRITGPASIPLFALGAAFNLMPLTGGAKAKAGQVVKQIALKSRTINEFKQAMDKVPPDIKSFVENTIKSKKNPFNSLEDIYKSVREKALPPLRTPKPGSFSNLRTADDPLATVTQDFPKVKAPDVPLGRQLTYDDLARMRSEPLPWEEPSYIEMMNKRKTPTYITKQEQDRAIITGILNENKNPLKSAFSKVSPDIQDAIRTWDAEIKVAQVEANKVAYSFKTGLNPELEYRLVKYSQSPTPRTAQELKLTSQELALGDNWLQLNRKLNDAIFERATIEGIDLNYLKNHIIQAFKESPEQIEEVMRAKGLGTKPGFAQHRTIRSFQEAEELGFTPRYTSFGQLNALAEQELQKALANKRLFQKLIDSGQLLPANTPNIPPNWRLVNVPYFPQAARKVSEFDTVLSQYKAPPELARLLENIFGTEGKSLSSMALHYGGKVARTMQDVALSGGIGPLNFFGIGQLIKEITAGRILKPVGAFLRSFSSKLSKEFEIANAEVIKEMAAHNIKPRGIANFQTLYKNVKESKTIKELVGETWNKFINEPTFGRFLNQLQIEFYKDAKSALLRNGIVKEKAIETAAKATKNFYGISDAIGRSKDIDNALSLIFLAPKYRESMVNIFKNIGKGILDPRNYGKAEYAGVQRLAAGMAITYGLYNYAQKKLTGNYLWDNPPGREFELVIPVGDPKDKKYISFPFMPGFTAVPRRIAGTGTSLAKGDIKEAGRQFSSLYSVPISKGGELFANQDYWGNPIYGEGTTPQQTIGYGVNAFLPGYARGVSDYLTGRSTPAFAIAQGLELPIRKGTFPNPYFAARDEAMKNLSENDKAQVEYLLTSDKNGGPDSATEAKMMLANPKLLQVKKTISLASNPNDPLYSRTDDDIKAFLAYRASTDTQTKAQIRVAYPWIPQAQYEIGNALYNSQQSRITPTAGYNPNSIQGQLGRLFNPPKPVDTSGFIAKPQQTPMQQLSKEQVQIASLYTALPGTSSTNPAKRQLLNANPWLRNYWDANSAYYAANPYEEQGVVADFLKSIGIDPNSALANNFKSYFSKRPKKVSIKLSKAPRFKAFKWTKAKMPKIKLSKGPTIKLTAAKSPKKFKVTAIKVKYSRKPLFA